MIEERLGGGGFGEVFRASERLPKRQVALKFVRPERLAEPAFVQRFEREVNAMAELEHPNVVPVYRHGEFRGMPYFAMRFVPGGSLAAILDEGRLSLADVVELLAGVADGLDFCHTLEIVHRDLKPANILVDSARGCGLLADFGIALTDDHSTLTGAGAGALLGTPAYMAPETLLGARATFASDLWALGAIAYRAATGALPRGTSRPLDAEPVPPSRRNDDLGAEIDHVLLRALSVDPAGRYSSAGAFVADLRSAVERSPRLTTSTRPPARTHGGTESASRPARSRRTTVASPQARSHSTSVSPRATTSAASGQAPLLATPPSRRGRGAGLARRLGPGRLWSAAGAALVLIPALVYGAASLSDGASATADCHPSYTGACLKPGVGDYDCKGGPGDGPNFVSGPIKVVGRDVYSLDGDGDGIAC